MTDSVSGERNSVTPAPPGATTNIDGIPQELKNIPNWVLYFLAPKGDGTFKKIPVPHFDLNQGINVLDRTKFGTFQDCVRAMQSDTANKRYGVGFVLTPEAGIVVIDIDNKAQQTEEQEARLQTVISEILTQAPTYVEHSISGQGYHIVYKARLPTGDASANNLVPGVEIYAHNRFIAITGSVVDRYGTRINDGNDVFVELFASRPEQNGNHILIGDDQLGPTVELGRALNLTDTHVLEVLRYKREGTYNILTGNMPCTDFSVAALQIVGDLDKITGDPNQISRIVNNSKLLRVATGDHLKEDRAHKFQRLFTHWLRDVRYGKHRNTESLLTHVTPASVEHGKQLSEQFLAGMEYFRLEELRREEAERSAAAEAHKQLVTEVKARGKETGQFTGRAIEAIEYLSCDINRGYLTECAPPGRMGRYCDYATQGMYEPFMKFAIPATLSIMAGITARRFKLPDGSGPNIQILMFALSASGKTQAIDAWGNFISSLRSPNTVSNGHFFKKRFIATDAKSVQGLHKMFQETPSVTWVKDECAALLRAIIDPRDNNEEALNGLFNQLFDAGKVNSFVAPVASIRSQKDDEKPIRNLCVSTFWACTPASVSSIMNEEAIEKGTMSRMLFMSHTSSAGVEQDPNKMLRDIPAGEDRVRLLELVTLADEIDEQIAQTGGYDAELDYRTVQYDDAALELYSELRRRIGIFKRALHDGSSPFPGHYLAFSRLAMIVARVAALCAIVENPTRPLITRDELSWALGYVLRSTGGMLSGFDRNDYGATLSTGMVTMVRILTELAVKYTDGIPRGQIINRARAARPFKEHGTHAKRLIVDLLEELNEDDAIYMAVSAPATGGGRGAPKHAVFIRPEHKYFKKK